MKERGTFGGVLQIVRYNTRFYAAAAPAVLLLTVLSKNHDLPRPLRTLVSSIATLMVWWTLASLLVSHLVYDRSPLMRWHWIEGVLQYKPRRWLNLHCGLDESTDALRELFPDIEGTALDFFDERTMSEPSIRIARKLQQQTCRAADLRALPCSDTCFDTIFLFFAAHEIRDAKLRLRFFRELHRVLSDGGQVVLAEHPRDLANFLAFGPGFLHFWPRSEWQRLAQESDFEIAQEFSITPFVRVWVLEK